ncbi:MAG: cation-transporting P-type ATPase [Gammaproteobacteria bacterium]|nr:cation-transporting P-type ATPase [Gammaproteobacteria bacterium]
MKIHHLSVDDALASLHARASGLVDDEVQHRLQEFGRNELMQVQGLPVYRIFLKGFAHFLALILLLASALAFFLEWREPGQGMLFLGIAILAVILINGVFSFWQEYRAGQALAALRQLIPQQVKVLRDANIQQIVATELVPGDIVLLEEGDDVPADCRVIEAFGLRVNNATVTGESVPKARGAAPCDQEELLYARNIVLAGTSVVSGQARALVFATAMHTEFGQIAGLTQQVGETLSPLQREIVRMSRWIALLALALGALFFIIGQFVGLGWGASLVFAIGIIVANVPEGLLPTVSLALAMGAQRMARRNALIRHLPAVETLGTTTVICTDKTGTLTQNQMVVRQLWRGGQLVDAAMPDGAGHYQPLYACARWCHNLKQSNGEHGLHYIGDPMEQALMALADAHQPPALDHHLIDEIPFDSTRKRMSMVYQTATGQVLYTKGAPETVLPLCSSVLIDGHVQPLDQIQQAQLLAAQQAMASKGLRVLALATRNIAADTPQQDWEQGLTLSGLVGLEDPPRAEVPAAIRACRMAGIRVIMITGDHPQTALAIAREIGLVTGDSPVVIIGEQLQRMSRSQLQLALDAPEILFARVAADQKMRVVAALKRKGEVVAVTGDGVNDAPALKMADIGIAMGRSGTDVAREAADMVLLDDNFASIVAAIEEGRAVYQNIRKFLTYILTSNIPELIPYLAFVLFKIPLPLTVIQILAVDLGTDMLPALALGAEPPDPRIMQQPPRPRSERLLNLPLLLRAYLFLGMFEALAALAAFFFVLKAGGWHYGELPAWNDPLYLQATTACLTAIIIMQMMNLFICRSERGSAFAVPLAGNHLLFWGLLTELALILLIDYTAIGNTMFGTAPIGWQVWLFVLPFAALMLLAEELRKWLLRRGAQAQSN